MTQIKRDTHTLIGIQLHSQLKSHTHLQFNKVRLTSRLTDQSWKILLNKVKWNSNLSRHLFMKFLSHVGYCDVLT